MPIARRTPPPFSYLACTSMGTASPGGAPSAGGGAPSAGAAGAATGLGSMGLPSGPISMTIACAWRKLGLVTVFPFGVVLFWENGAGWHGWYAYEHLK